MEDFLEGRVASASRSETVRAGAKAMLNDNLTHLA
jgi:hypothetical protein